MANRSRTFLKNLFKQNAIPTEQNFGDLIDSYYNFVDDTLSIDRRGLVIGDGYKGQAAPENGLLVEGEVQLSSLTVGSGVNITAFDSSSMLSNNNSVVPTQGAVKAYADTKANLQGSSDVAFATQNLSVNGYFTFDTLPNGNEVKVNNIANIISTASTADEQTLLTEKAIKAGLELKANVQGDSAADFNVRNLYAQSIETNSLLINNPDYQVTNIIINNQLSFANSSEYPINSISIDGEFINSNDTTLATQLAVKSYVDAAIADRALVDGDSEQDFQTANLSVNGQLQLGDILAPAIDIIKSEVTAPATDTALLTETAIVDYVALKTAEPTTPTDEDLITQTQNLSGSLAKVLQLQGVSFEWLEPTMSSGTQFGFIAQQVEAVIPELVTTDDDGYKNIAYAELLAFLTEAIKEQQAQIDTLSQELADLANNP